MKLKWNYQNKRWKQQAFKNKKPLQVELTMKKLNSVIWMTSTWLVLESVVLFVIIYLQAMMYISLLLNIPKNEHNRKALSL